MTASHVAECPDLGPECGSSPQPTPFNHHIDQVIAESAFLPSYGITENFGVDARWSLRVVDVKPTYSELNGDPKEVANDIHHHDETRVDLTDPWLSLRLAATASGLVSVARLGVTLPVGRTEPDPYAAGREGLSHEHLQAGTGTFVPMVGFGFSYTIAPVTLSLGGVGFFSLYANNHGFRAPTRMYASQRATVSLFDGELSPFVEISEVHEGEEYWNGSPNLEGSNVRTELYGGAGASAQVAEGWSVDGAVRARFATLTDAASFTTYGIFSLGITARFDVAGNKPAAGPRVREQRRGDVLELEKE